MKVLFVGNSYTYYHDMPEVFRALCRENGRDVEVFSVTAGGRKLVQNAEGNDEKAEMLKTLARENRFDVVILQEQSLLPIVNNEMFMSGVKGVYEMLKSSADRFVLYATWGRKTGSPDLATLEMDHDSMTEALAEAYGRAASEIGADISPVGYAFSEAMRIDDGIELYHSDKTHPSDLGTALGALVHYRTCFAEMPQSIASLGALDGAEDVLIRAVVKVSK